VAAALIDTWERRLSLNITLQSDLVNAHADALVRGESDYRERYSALFPEEMEALEFLFVTAEEIFELLAEPVFMRAEARADLKASLLAQAHQQRLRHRCSGWQWAALGASAVTVAGVIAAAAWRGSHARVISRA
jgi:hypothetical protein